MNNYKSNTFTSPCCHMFVYHVDNNIFCSSCNNLIYSLKDDDVLTISVKLNTDDKVNISGDIIKSFENKAKRFSCDETYELCSVKCNKCKSYTRIARNPQGNLIFICSNEKCRNVFYNS